MNPVENANNPLVSVIMPAYNHERFVEEAVRSVWGQTYSNVELIALDDGSNDNTGDILERLNLSSPIKMRVIRKSNEGLCKTLNAGLEIASGKYISLLASDDRYLENHSQTLVSVMEDNRSKKIGFVYGNVQLMDSNGMSTNRTQFDGKRPKSGDLFEDLLFFRNIPQGAANIYRSDLLKKVGGFNEKYIGEGIDLYLRLSKDYECLYVDSCLSEYRITQDGTNLNAKVSPNMEYLLSVFETHLGNHEKSSSYFWKKWAYSNAYARVAELHYANRDLKLTRLWIGRSLMQYPLHGRMHGLFLRTLLGNNLLEGIKQFRDIDRNA